MKKLFVALAASTVLLGSSSVAQDTIGMQKFETPCADRAYVDRVTQKFEEVPTLRANSVRRIGEGEGDFKANVTVLYINHETKSWTLVERTGENTYCFIAVGSEISLINSKGDSNPKPKKGKAM